MKGKDNSTTKWTGNGLNQTRGTKEFPGAALKIKPSETSPSMLGRRQFLRVSFSIGAGVLIGALVGGCSDSPPTLSPSPTSLPLSTLTGSVDATSEDIEQAPAEPKPTDIAGGSGSKILLAYFSRAGENYYYGGRTQLAIGNTQVLAGMISQRIGCDVYRIEPVDPYPDDYEETRARNLREQEADARPAIANPLTSLEPYDTVLLGSPIWNVRAPMIMSTFVEGLNLIGKTVIPFTTYAVSGLGTTVRDYTASCPGATIGEGLAVRGEEVRDAGAEVEAWLQRVNLLTR